jgi:hypothetical protein
MITDDQLVEELRTARDAILDGRLAWVGAEARLKYRIRSLQRQLNQIAEECLWRTRTAITDGDEATAYEWARLLAACYVPG